MTLQGYLIGTDVRTTYICSGFGSGHWRPVQYAVVGKLAVLEGCIILGTVDEMEEVAKRIRDNPALLTSTESLGSGIKGRRYRWPEKTIPYEIDPNLPDPARVTDAIKEWEGKTSIRFVARTAAHDDHVVFVPGDGCASYVGRQGGRQEIILGSSCSKGNAIHEIGHTVGLWHEQSRADRDTHVEIVFQNILPAYRYNFEQHIDDGIDIGSYDYGSIMHYPPNAFSRNGQPTIRKRRDEGPDIGQRLALSAGDVAAVAKLYS